MAARTRPPISCVSKGEGVKKSFAARRLQKLQESVIRSITRYARSSLEGTSQLVRVEAGSSFYSSDPQLGRGLVRFAFPKKDATLDEVERRFAKLN